MARDGRINIMVDEVIKEKFHQMALTLGLTDSALGAHMIGQAVYQQELSKQITEQVIRSSTDSMIKAANMGINEINSEK